jgi:long-chain acyl-CoA synthetase
MAAYKYPRIVEVVSEFPLGPSGKILKRELRSRFPLSKGASAIKAL